MVLNGTQQQQHGREELIASIRALLMTPLMAPTHEEFSRRPPPC
jgi:hypothetical protein